MYRSASEIYGRKYQQLSSHQTQIATVLRPLRSRADYRGNIEVAISQYQNWREESGNAVKRFLELSQVVNKLGKEVMETIRAGRPAVNDVIASARRVDRELQQEEYQLMPIQVIYLSDIH